jgi:hypothetical protein
MEMVDNFVLMFVNIVKMNFRVPKLTFVFIRWLTNLSIILYLNN